MDYWVAVRKLLIALRSSLTTYDPRLTTSSTNTNPATRAGHVREGKGWNALASLGFWEGVGV